MDNNTRKIDVRSIFGQSTEVSSTSSTYQQSNIETQLNKREKNIKKSKTPIVENNELISSQTDKIQNQQFIGHQDEKPIIIRPNRSSKLNTKVAANVNRNITEKILTQEMHHQSKIIKKPAKKNRNMILRRATIVNVSDLPEKEDNFQLSSIKINRAGSAKPNPTFKTVTDLILEGLESEDDDSQSAPTEL